MKRTLALVLTLILALSGISIIGAGAEEADFGSPSAMPAKQALFVHAVSGSTDTEAWQAWQSVHDEDFYEANPNEKYFFLPSSVTSDTADVYNGFSQSVTLNGTAIAAGETKTVTFSAGKSYTVYADSTSYTLKFMRSTAEAAIYVNAADKDLMAELNADKSVSSAATGAIVTPDGALTNAPVKKIKGRGNTTWQKAKKGYNITFTDKVSIAGMAKNKKYSILANYQDDSLSRNRFLYDLSDAVGMPYASDSRYVDFYVNGYYWGSYQMCEKVEAGSLVPEVSDDGYLNEDGTIKEDFPFIAEVDASAGDEDYYVTCSGGIKVTIKSPEIDPGMPGYDEVKAYVNTKFSNFITKFRNAVRRPADLSDIADIDSCAKLYLINELGKNWDAGVSSTFFTYKQDENGNYKFYGSPVWDYDNSLGNATGVAWDLRNMGVSDYTLPTGWWCRYKGKSSSDTMSYNLINNFARNDQVLEAAAQIWFDEFLPAINHFRGKTVNTEVKDELYSSQEYFALIKGSADMNYTSGWLLNTGGWIAQRQAMKKSDFDFLTGAYTQASNSTGYANNFTGMYNYAADWMINRAAWLSDQMYSSYTGSKVEFDVDRDGAFSIDDVTLLQRHLAKFKNAAFNPLQFELAEANGSGKLNIDDATHMQRILAEII